MDIGRISSYIDVHHLLMKRHKIKNFLGKKCEIHGVLNKSCLGDNVYIGKNSKLDSTIVYNNSVIGENVNLSYCVIGEYCKINNSVDIKRSVLGDNEKLEEKTVLDNKAIWTQQKPKNYPDKQIGNPIEN
jgi:NDP-sugar pyrophosphorylase family protein